MITDEQVEAALAAYHPNWPQYHEVPRTPAATLRAAMRRALETLQPDAAPVGKGGKK